MILLSIDQLPNGFRARFDLTQPASLRLGTALEGITLVRVLAGDPPAPTWAILQETCYGTIYPGGVIDASTMRHAIEYVRADRDVLLGMWPETELEGNLAPTLGPSAEYDGWMSDFTDRVSPAIFDQYLQIPVGCRLEPLTSSFVYANLNPGWFIDSFGSVERALKNGFGLALLQGDGLLCQAFAGPSLGGLIGVGADQRYWKRKAAPTGASSICTFSRVGAPELGAAPGQGVKVKRSWLVRSTVPKAVKPQEKVVCL